MVHFSPVSDIARQLAILLETVSCSHHHCLDPDFASVGTLNIHSKTRLIWRISHVASCAVLHSLALYLLLSCI